LIYNGPLTNDVLIKVPIQKMIAEMKCKVLSIMNSAMNYLMDNDALLELEDSNLMGSLKACILIIEPSVHVQFERIRKIFPNAVVSA